MTVISPSQKQLVFTQSFSEKMASRKKQKKAVWRFVGSLSRLILGTGGAFNLLLVFFVLVSFGILLLGVDAVLLSFKIRAVSRAINERKVEREALEIKHARVLSFDSLKEYASMIQLVKPQKISYLAADELFFVLGNEKDLPY